MPELVLPWADRVSSVDVETDSHLPEIVDGVNAVLNRRRLSRWLSVFGEDADVNDFLLLDAIISSLNIPVSSTGAFGPSSSLGLRPFRLWEYSWIYKCLALAKGGWNVLDIGGPGSHLSLLTALAGNRVQSIDLNPEFVDAANRVARTFSLSRYNAFIGDGRDLSGFEAGSFDAVICCSVLEHLTSDNQRIVLQQIARVLRPGGLAGLTFDYGPGAPGANIHLPPPHEPPGSACEAMARYEVGGLQIVGNRNLEEPLPGSLFRSPTIQYTIASLFVARPPVAEIKLPVPENSSASVLKQVRISNLIVRSFDASVARYEAETAAILADYTPGAAADTEPASKPESQPVAQLQNELRYAEERAATAENLVELQRGQIQDLQNTTRIQKEEIERQYCQSQHHTVELSRHADRLAEVEGLYAEASRERKEEIERRRSETEAHMAAESRSVSQIGDLENAILEGRRAVESASREIDSLHAELEGSRKALEDMSIYADRVSDLEDLYAEASRVRNEEVERWRSETEAHSVAESRYISQVEELENAIVEGRRAVEDASRKIDSLHAQLEGSRRALADQVASATAALATLNSDAALLRTRLAESERNAGVLDSVVAGHRKDLTALSTEPPFKLLFRRYLNRVPGPANQFTLHAVPRFFTPSAILAVAHQWINKGIARYVQSYNPPPAVLPRITVVTPVFNGEDYIGRAIESVLSQGYPNLEYFIEDGASTDGTLSVVERYRDGLAGISSQPDHGMYDAIGRGLERATGEIFCYLNSDDVLLPGALFRVGEFFARHPKTDVIYHEDIVDVNGWRYPNVAQKHVGFNDLLKGHILFQDGVFFRRRAYEAVGGVNRRLRLAGDWDLWTRMARRFRFKKLPGHVSCFYVRGGQLSSRMDDYNAEMSEGQRALRSELKTPEKVRHAIEDLVLRVRNYLDAPPDRLFFPIDFTQMPPPRGQVPERKGGIPRCPITEALPSRLLFSSRDTRFGFPLINDFYYVPESHVAVCDPPLSDEFLSYLYETYYSTSNPYVIGADPNYGSPYRLYRGPGLALRFVRNILAPRLLSRLVRLSWDDQTPVELIAGLKSAGVDVARPLSFLDVGCFEGHLLDNLQQRTNWTLHGLEFNPAAARVACAKGHRIYTAAALDAVFVLPTDQRFDVVFLGQVIEHLSDPVKAMRRLSTLLKPDGKLVITTPNLDSRQISLFGPASSHWHPPYHRQIFSLRALELMASRLRLRMDYSSSRSHPYWTALSLWLSNMGLGASVPHGIAMPPEITNHARSIATWSKLLWDYRGKGDYLCVVFSRK